MSVLETCEQWPTRAVGVTFASTTGGNRQEVLTALERMYGADISAAQVALMQYDYCGTPAFRVMVDGQDVGSLSAKLARQLSARISAGWHIELLYPRLIGGPDPDTGVQYLGFAFTICLLAPHQYRAYQAELAAAHPVPTYRPPVPPTPEPKKPDSSLWGLKLLVTLALAGWGLVFFGTSTAIMVAFLIGSAIWTYWWVRKIFP